MACQQICEDCYADEEQTGMSAWNWQAWGVCNPPTFHYACTLGCGLLSSAAQQAQMVSQFEDHELWYPGTQQGNTVYIGDHWVVSFCRVRGGGGVTVAAAAAKGS